MCYTGGGPSGDVPYSGPAPVASKPPFSFGPPAEGGSPPAKDYAIFEHKLKTPPTDLTRVG